MNSMHLPNHEIPIGEAHDKRIAFFTEFKLILAIQFSYECNVPCRMIRKEIQENCNEFFHLGIHRFRIQLTIYHCIKDMSTRLFLHSIYINNNHCLIYIYISINILRVFLFTSIIIIHVSTIFNYSYPDIYKILRKQIYDKYIHIYIYIYIYIYI